MVLQALMVVDRFFQLPGQRIRRCGISRNLVEKIIRIDSIVQCTWVQAVSSG